LPVPFGSAAAARAATLPSESDAVDAALSVYGSMAAADRAGSADQDEGREAGIPEAY
jgi:hypothetical protein